MDFTGVSTAELCKAVAAELRNRGVDYTLLAIVDDEPCVYMPAKIRGDSDRLARGTQFASLPTTTGPIFRFGECKDQLRQNLCWRISSGVR